MKIETKYNIGQTVYWIISSREKLPAVCDFCNGTGQITGHNNKTRHCPECRGRTQFEWSEDKYLVRGPLTIGQVRAYAGYNDNVDYMCTETGLGSGSLYDEKRLFPTYAEAQAECDRRNNDN